MKLSMLSKGTVDLYNIVKHSQPLLSSHLTVYVDYMYPTMEVIFGCPRQNTNHSSKNFSSKVGVITSSKTESTL